MVRPCTAEPVRGKIAVADWKRIGKGWASFGVSEVLRAKRRRGEPEPVFGDPGEAAGADADRAQAAGEPQRVFISYRRSDCQAQANGLMGDLRWRGAQVFMDLDSIPAGTDFEEYIHGWIAHADVVLVLIGDNWLEETGAGRRLDREDDFVRLEVRAALEQGKRIIPVVVEGAQMPHPSELPDDISRLSRIQSFELSDRRWMSDLKQLAETVLSPSGG